MRIFPHYSIDNKTNFYLVACEVTQQMLLVDPVEFSLSTLDAIELGGYKLEAILITHSHNNHINALEAIMRIYEVPIYALATNLRGYKTKNLKENSQFKAAGLNVEAIHILGHTSDSVVYKIENCLFTGDSLMAGMAPQASSLFNFRLLYDEIENKIFTFPDHYLIFPGHGPVSTLKTEKKYNLLQDKSFLQENLSSDTFSIYKEN